MKDHKGNAVSCEIRLYYSLVGLRVRTGTDSVVGSTALSIKRKNSNMYS
jgi:hypothetical protein